MQDNKEVLVNAASELVTQSIRQATIAVQSKVIPLTVTRFSEELDINTSLCHVH